MHLENLDGGVQPTNYTKCKERPLPYVTEYSRADVMRKQHAAQRRDGRTRGSITGRREQHTGSTNSDSWSRSALSVCSLAAVDDNR